MNQVNQPIPYPSYYQFNNNNSHYFYGHSYNNNKNNHKIVKGNPFGEDCKIKIYEIDKLLKFDVEYEKVEDKLVPYIHLTLKDSNKYSTSTYCVNAEKTFHVKTKTSGMFKKFCQKQSKIITKSKKIVSKWNDLCNMLKDKDKGLL